MLKKLISIAMASLMALTITTTAFAAETDDNTVGAEANSSAGAEVSDSSAGAGNKIYFDSTGWKNVKKVYCYIWVTGGDSFYGWQAKATTCDHESGSIYSFDLAKLNNSTFVEGGLQSDEDYCVIFSADTGAQTYDLTFGTACIGDTVKLTNGPEIENPKDSEKTSYEAVWKTNNVKYGPHLALTSIGNIVGKVLCPHENSIKIVGDWLDAYYASPHFKAEDALVKILPRFKVTDIDAVYAYICSKESGNDTEMMKKMLQNAYEKAYREKKVVSTEKVKDILTKLEKGEEIEEIVTTTPVDDSVSDNDSAPQSDNSYNGDSGDISGTGADGQEDTIFFALAGVMLAAAGVMFVTRKKKEN